MKSARSSSKGLYGTNSMTSTGISITLSWGRLPCNCARVSNVLGANAAPVSSCRARDNWPSHATQCCLPPSNLVLRPTPDNCRAAWLSIGLTCILKEFCPSAPGKIIRPLRQLVPTHRSSSSWSMHQHHWDQPEHLPSASFSLNVSHLPCYNTPATFRERSEDTFSTWELASRTTRSNRPGPTVPTIFQEPQVGQRSTLFSLWQCNCPRHRLDSARSPLMQSDQQCNARVCRASLVDNGLLHPSRKCGVLNGSLGIPWPSTM